MRPGIVITLSLPDRGRLEAIVADRNMPQKHVWRANIVLLSAEGIGTNEIMRRTGTSKTCVWRWQERFATEGVEGLLRDMTRPSRVPPLGQGVIGKVVALTATEPPHEATHWTAAAMAKAVAADLEGARVGAAPHTGIQTLRGSRLRAETARHRRALHRSAHAVVPSVDEKARSRRSIAPSPACHAPAP
jgi:hypothetical protein